MNNERLKNGNVATLKNCCKKLEIFIQAKEKRRINAKLSKSLLLQKL